MANIINKIIKNENEKDLESKVILKKIEKW